MDTKLHKLAVEAALQKAIDAYRQFIETGGALNDLSEAAITLHSNAERLKYQKERRDQNEYVSRRRSTFKPRPS